MSGGRENRETVGGEIKVKFGADGKLYVVSVLIFVALTFSL